MKRGQAALEFLMTYGWAILVVLAAIAALAYFGVFNVKSLAPDSCTLSTGYVCTAQVTATSVAFNIYNGAGSDITAVSVALTDIAGCDTVADAIATLTDGTDDTTEDLVGCVPGAQGAKIKEDLTFTYTDDAGFTHNVPGKLVATVE